MAVLCHIHTTWSDGEYSLDDVVALYGETGFDVIAITLIMCLTVKASEDREGRFPTSLL